ncbi:MAG: hypothetical protein LLG02_16255 [Pelosinus sp.]|nr:hypothetical protein [Pelosinus sp.]
MRILGLLIIFMGVFYIHVMAIAPVTDELIKEAQEYGKYKSSMEYTEFLTPWTSYEEKAFKLDETTDRAYLYSPFLCLAADSREKVLKGQKVDIADSDKVLQDYGGFLIFSVTLFGQDEQFAKNITAALNQDKKYIAAHQASVPAGAAKMTLADNRVVYMVQAYFYFQEQDTAADKPVLLTVSNENMKRSFYFDLAKIK